MQPTHAQKKEEKRLLSLGFIPLLPRDCFANVLIEK